MREQSRKVRDKMSLVRSSDEGSRSVVEIAPGITISPDVRFGHPVLKGTRVPVEKVVARIAAGMSPHEVAEEYGLELEEVYCALRYAVQLLSEELVVATG